VATTRTKKGVTAALDAYALHLLHVAMGLRLCCFPGGAAGRVPTCAPCRCCKDGRDTHCCWPFPHPHPQPHPAQVS